LYSPIYAFIAACAAGFTVGVGTGWGAVEWVGGALNEVVWVGGVEVVATDIVELPVVEVLTDWM
jgi:hypothetical protein